MRGTQIMEEPIETQIIADCPHCSRSEQFDDEPTARAWMNGHIQEAHPEKLPEYSTTDTEQ